MQAKVLLETVRNEGAKLPRPLPAGSQRRATASLAKLAQQGGGTAKKNAVRIHAADEAIAQLGTELIFRA